MARPVIPETCRNRTTDGRWVVIRAYGRDEVYETVRGLEMFRGYVGDGAALPPALWAQHQLLMSFWRSKHTILLECPLRWNGRWEARTGPAGGTWQPIDGLPVL